MDNGFVRGVVTTVLAFLMFAIGIVFLILLLGVLLAIWNEFWSYF